MTKTERNLNSEAGKRKKKMSEERAWRTVELGGEMKGKEKMHLS